MLLRLAISTSPPCRHFERFLSQLKPNWKHEPPLEDGEEEDEKEVLNVFTEQSHRLSGMEIDLKSSHAEIKGKPLRTRRRG